MSEEYQREYMVSIGERPWGQYIVLGNFMDHKVKEITVWPDRRLSLQRHRKRDEHWFIQKGQARVIIDDTSYDLQEGESINVPRNAAHRIENRGEGALVFIEVQTGDYFGEDDIERIEDDYHRESEEA